MRRAVVCLIAAFSLAFVGQPAHAGWSDAEYGRQVGVLERRVSSMDPARGAVPGYAVLRNGRFVYIRNDNRAMLPASLQKLLTTTAAMLRFGPETRFATRVVAAAPISGGTIAGSMTIVGGGDPTLSTAAFAGRAYRRDSPSGKISAVSFVPTIELLADGLAKTLGLRRIEGDLVADESIFDSSRWQRGWQSSYQKGEIDVGNLSGLSVNQGLGDAEGKTVAASPALLTATYLRDALKARGVTITGAVKMGRASSSAVEITRISSAPLKEIVFYTNRWSVNYPAEMLLKGMGARFGGAGTTSAGVTVLKQALSSRRVDVRNLVVEDGSGLSTLNRVSPRVVATVLQLMLSMPDASGAALRNSLPVAGGAGSLLYRMTGAPTGGNLRGKTGLLKGVRALAGWVKTRDGAIATYVALYNNCASASAMTPVHDAFGTGLAKLPT
jgi:D-alanyl-D-alanine carboxypeptidase/D-alanyl-D-alanine-endopeptidase (penicillin-binding protein 4)